MLEVWKGIPDYEDHYQVSNIGRVRSIKKNNPRLLKPTDNGNGYLYFTMSIKSKLKKISVHRAVCLAFYGVPDEKMVCNHKNHNTKDNKVENLEWVTQKENLLWNHIKGKVSEKRSMKKVYCYNNKKVYECASYAGKELMIDASSITKVCRKKRNHVHGYRFDYLKNKIGAISENI